MSNLSSSGISSASASIVTAPEVAVRVELVPTLALVSSVLMMLTETAIPTPASLLAEGSRHLVEAVGQAIDLHHA